MRCVCALIANATQTTDGAIPGAEPLRTPPGTEFKDCQHCPEMIVVPGGTFTMSGKLMHDGVSEHDEVLSVMEGYNPSNTPPDSLEKTHKVVIGYSFAMGIYDVTRDGYAAFVSDTGRRRDGCYQWNNITWIDEGKANWREPRVLPDRSRSRCLCEP